MGNASGKKILIIGIAFLAAAMIMSVVSMSRDSLLILSIPAAIFAIVGTGVCGLGLYRFFEEIKVRK